MDHACDRCGPILTGSNKLVQDTFECFEIRRIEASLIRRFCQRLIAVFLAVSLRFSGVSREALALSVPVSARSGRPSRLPGGLADQNTRPPTKLHHATRPLSVLTQPQSL